MKWINLKLNICPKCNKDFTKGLMQETRGDFLSDKPAELFLWHKGCGFTIREKRYKQIVVSQITADLERRLEQEQGED